MIRLAATDLGDRFRSEYQRHTDAIGNDTQPYTEGYQVKFNIFVGLNAKGPLQVDLVVGAHITGEVTTVAPATTLGIPRLVSLRLVTAPFTNTPMRRRDPVPVLGVV